MQGRSSTALRAITALSLALAAGSATADVITQTVDIGPLTTNWIKNLAVNQFDAALGDLTKVEVLVTGHIESQYQIESFQSSASSHFFRLTGELKVLNPDASLLAAASVLNERTDDLTAYDGLFDSGGSSGLTAGISKDMTPGAAEFVGGGVAAFIGGGVLNFPVSATMNSFFQGSSNVFRAVYTQASAQIEVRYTYTPVPTPGAIGVLGVAGLMAARRRR